MTDPTTQSLLDSIPLFALPDFVVFPSTPVPLHFFEPRYRAMIEDVVTSDNLIVTVRLAPGWEGEYEGAPPIEPIGTLTRVVTHRSNSNGTHDAVLLGLGRVAIESTTATARGYRVARVKMLDERMDVSRDTHASLVACASRLIALLRVRHPHLTLDIDADTPSARVVDTLADRFVSGPDDRSALLAITDAAVRAERVLEAMAALTLALEPNSAVS
jgi:uncharacterized protein